MDHIRDHIQVQGRHLIPDLIPARIQAQGAEVEAVAEVTILMRKAITVGKKAVTIVKNRIEYIYYNIYFIYIYFVCILLNIITVHDFDTDFRIGDNLEKKKGARKYGIELVVEWN